MPRVSKKILMQKSLASQFFDDAVPPQALGEVFDTAMHNAVLTAMWFWFEVVLPRHFERSAHQQYNYQERKRVTIARKLRAHPESRGADLVFSGTLRTQATRFPSSPPTVRNVRGGYEGRIVVSVPKHVTLNRHVDMIAEMKRYSVKDVTEMLQVVGDVVHESLFGV